MRYNHFDMLPDRAFLKVGGKIMPQGGGGTPTQTTQTASTIPNYAQPYVMPTLGQGQALTDVNQNPYQPYKGQMLAGFSPMQAQGMAGVANQQVAPQISDASNLAYQSGIGGLGAYQGAADLQNASLGYGAEANAYGGEGFKSGQLGQQLGVQGGAKFGNMGAGFGQNAAGLAGQSIGTGQAGMAAGMGYGASATDPNAVGAYMNPYLQNTLTPAMQLLDQQYGMQGAQQQGAATSAGAFGGSREALMSGLTQQNKNLAQNQLVSGAYNQAYNTANQNMQAASSLGMQGAGVGLAGLNAANQNYATGIQGANTGLQGVNTQLAGTAQGMQGAQIGIQGAQAGMQGVQGAVGAGQYGLAGLGQANASAGTLGNLGQGQYAQQQGISQAQMQAGAQQQALQQRGLDTAYAQYQQQLQYPYQQLSFMQGLYAGLPMQNQAQSMYQNPSAVSQAAGLGTAAMGAYGMYKMGQKEGGLTKSMADGGITQLFDVGGSIKSDLSRMSPQELQEYIGESSSPTAKRMAQQLLAEKTAVANQQNPGVTQLPSNLPVGEPVGAAGGGIIAFAAGDRVESSDPSNGSSGDTRADADAYLRRLLAGGDENIQPIPGSEMAQAAPTNDANPVALPVAAPTPTTGAALPPPQNAGVTSLVAKPPTRLPAAGATPVPAAPATSEKSVYGNMPLMSPEAKEAFSQYAGLYKDMRGDNKKAREEAKWMAIMQAGLGIAGGTSPNALANISQGAQPAIAQFQSAIKDIRKDDREAVKGLIELGLTKEKFMQEVQKMGIDADKAQKVYDATIEAAKINNEGRLAAAIAGRQPKSTTEGDITDRQIQNGIVIDNLTEKAKTQPLTEKEQAQLNTAMSSNKYYMDILGKKNPPPSNLSGVAGIATGESGAVNNALAKWSGQDALDIAYLANNEPVIKKLTAEKATIEAKARQEYRQSVKEAGGMSNRPLNSTSGAGTGAGGANGATTNNFIVGRAYTSNGLTKVYKGKDKSNNDIWE